MKESELTKQESESSDGEDEGNPAARHFGTALRRALGFRELSQSDISRGLDVSRATVSAWCAGTSMPSSENLNRLAELLEVRPSYLLSAPEAAGLLFRSPEYMRVYQELRELDQGDPEERKDQLDDVAEYIRFIRNRKPRRNSA